MHRLLVSLAALVWLVGAAVLLWKGTGRLLEAGGDARAWAMSAGAAGLVFGVLQGGTIFRRACIRNLDRIRALESPRPWQFFRARFFLALGAMIAFAVVLGILADSGPRAAAAVGGVDWLIGFSLLVSSAEFVRYAR